MMAWRPGGRRLPASCLSTVLVTVVVLVGCSPNVRAPLPAAPPVAIVTMREYRFDHGPIPRGRVVFQVKNEGHLAHRLSLIPLPADLPPIQEQLRGNQRQVVSTLAAVPDIPPGAIGTFAVDLAPGRYAMVCFIIDPDGISQALKGMATEFRVR